MLRFLLLLALTLCTATAQKPGVLLITVDGLGWGDLLNAQAPTPHMDKLLAESAAWRDFHVSPLDAPSRAALLTGMEPLRAGVWGDHSARHRLRPGLLTIAAHLRTEGYSTALCGTWALGDNAPSRPQDHGYAHVLTHAGGLPGGAADFFSNDGTDDLWLLNGEAVARPGSWTEALFAEALTWLEKNSARPFLLHLAPSLPPGMTDTKAAPHTRRAAWLAQLDAGIGKVMERLSANTIVILTATTGVPSGGKPARRGARGTPYESGHGVPLLIRWPAGGITAGNITTPAVHFDLLPTLAALTGTPLPPDARPDGLSLAPWMQPAATPPPALSRLLITDAQEIPVPVLWRRQCVMDGYWRLINGRELYDLRSDPGQSKNLAAAHPDTVQRLRTAAETWWQNLAPEKLQPVPTNVGGAQDPVLLTPHDWLARSSTALTRDAIIAGAPANFPWLLHIASEGNYDILLRRWPLTVNRALSDSFFTPDKARLRLGPLDETKPVLPGATGANFRVALKPGPLALQTWFTGGGKTSGAYFVEIRRAVEVRSAKPVPQPPQ
jgi:arylsulfatase A-like enzyme